MGVEEEGELAPASASDPARALLGCTQSQPNKKPFIGRVQLSQTGWEHVAFKNEEGGMREWGVDAGSGRMESQSAKIRNIIPGEKG